MLVAHGANINPDFISTGVKILYIVFGSCFVTMLGVIGWFFRRLFCKLDEHGAALATQSNALAVLVDQAPKISKRLEVAEERITAIRESTGELRGTIREAVAQLNRQERRERE